MASIKKRVWERAKADRARESDYVPTVSHTYERADVSWSCTRKKAYSNEKFAKTVAREMRSERGADVLVYTCDHCGQYHIGRAPGASSPP